MSETRVENPEFTPQIIKNFGDNRLYMRIPNGGKWVRPWIKRAIGSNKKVEWDGNFWVVSSAYRTPMVEAIMEKFGHCCIDTESKKGSRKCDTRCTDAKNPDDCVCECGGMNHQGTLIGYKQVGETTLVMSGERTWTRRILTDIEVEGNKHNG